MANSVTNMKCPNCGGGIDTIQANCNYCKQPILISTFNSVYKMPIPLLNSHVNTYQQALSESPDDKTLNSTMAMCYLKLKLYDEALSSFEKAVKDNFNNSETFFYAAVCLLKGKKAFSAIKSVIDKAEKYIQAALAIEPKGIYYYFWAYIKYDFYERKFFNTSPTYLEVLELGKSVKFSRYDVEQLFAVLGVANPLENK
ncbi:hypothetical protein FACS1894188_08190 [Clostridia bacterium]|nr:hypothetical protein FACS1894188_08190 [Clostridia bacterium]